MKVFFYDFDKVSGLKMSQASLHYMDETDSHSMSIEVGGSTVSVDIYPEELAGVYEGRLGEYLIHRIRRAVINEQVQHNQNFLLNELSPMIRGYVSEIAEQLGIEITGVAFAGGPSVACVDYRLEISSHTFVVSVMINKSELEVIEKGLNSGFLELKIRTALEKLKMKSEI